MGCACCNCCKTCCCGSFEKSAARLPEPFKTIALRMCSVFLHSDVQMDLAAITAFASKHGEDEAVLSFMQLIWASFTSHFADGADDYWLCTLDACAWMLVRLGTNCSDVTLQKCFCEPRGIAVMALRKANNDHSLKEVLRDLVAAWASENEVLAKGLKMETCEAANLTKQGDPLANGQDIDLAKVRLSTGHSELSERWWDEESSNLTLHALVRISAAQGCLSGALADVGATFPDGDTRAHFFRAAIRSALWTFGSELLWKIGDAACQALRKVTTRKDDDILHKQAVTLLAATTGVLGRWFEDGVLGAGPINEIARSAVTFGPAISPTRRAKTETASISAGDSIEFETYRGLLNSADTLSKDGESSEDSGSKEQPTKSALFALTESAPADLLSGLPRGYVFVEQVLLQGLQCRASKKIELEWAGSDATHLKALRQSVSMGGEGRNMVVEFFDRINCHPSDKEQFASPHAKAAPLVEITGHASQNDTNISADFERKLHDIFSHCDKDQDGRASMGELIQACREDAEMADFFHRPQEMSQDDTELIDADDCKSLEWQEFLDFFMLRSRAHASLVDRVNPMLSSTQSSGEVSEAEPSEAADAPLPTLLPRQIHRDIKLLLSKGLIISEEYDRVSGTEQKDSAVMAPKELEFGESSDDEAPSRNGAIVEAENTALKNGETLYHSTGRGFGEDEDDEKGQENVSLLARSEEASSTSNLQGGQGQSIVRDPRLPMMPQPLAETMNLESQRVLESALGAKGWSATQSQVCSISDIKQDKPRHEMTSSPKQAMEHRWDDVRNNSRDACAHVGSQVGLTPMLGHAPEQVAIDGMEASSTTPLNAQQMPQLTHAELHTSKVEEAPVQTTMCVAADPLAGELLDRCVTTRNGLSAFTDSSSATFHETVETPTSNKLEKSARENEAEEVHDMEGDPGRLAAATLGSSTSLSYQTPRKRQTGKTQGGAGPLPQAASCESPVRAKAVSPMFDRSQFADEDILSSIVAAPNEVLLEIDDTFQQQWHDSLRRDQSAWMSYGLKESTDAELMAFPRDAHLHHIIDDIAALWNQVDTIHSILDTEMASPRYRFDNRFAQDLVRHQPFVSCHHAAQTCAPSGPFALEGSGARQQNAVEIASTATQTCTNTFAPSSNCPRQLDAKQTPDDSTEQTTAVRSSIDELYNLEDGVKAQLQSIVSELAECKRELQAQQVSTAMLTKELRVASPSPLESHRGSVAEMPELNITSGSRPSRSPRIPAWPTPAVVTTEAPTAPLSFSYDAIHGSTPRDLIAPEVVPWDTQPIPWSAKHQRMPPTISFSSPRHSSHGMLRTISEPDLRGFHKLQQEPSTSSGDVCACLPQLRGSNFYQEVRDVDQKVFTYDRSFQRYVGFHYR